MALTGGYRKTPVMQVGVTFIVIRVDLSPYPADLLLRWGSSALTDTFI